MGLSDSPINSQPTPVPITSSFSPQAGVTHEVDHIEINKLLTQQQAHLVQDVQAREKLLLQQLFDVWVTRHDYHSQSCVFKATLCTSAHADVYCVGCGCYMCSTCDAKEHSIIRQGHLRLQQDSRAG